MLKIGLLIVGLVLLSGCMSEKERMLKEGYPAEFAQGYEDGCSTGAAAAGGYGSLHKRIRLYESSKDYRTGWEEGKALCFTRQQSIQKASLQHAVEQKLYEKKK